MIKTCFSQNYVPCFSIFFYNFSPVVFYLLSCLWSSPKGKLMYLQMWQTSPEVCLSVTRELTPLIAHTHTHTTHTLMLWDPACPPVCDSPWSSILLMKGWPHACCQCFWWRVSALCPGGFKWKPLGCCTQTCSTELLLSIFLREHLFTESVGKAVYLKFVSCSL